MTQHATRTMNTWAGATMLAVLVCVAAQAQEELPSIEAALQGLSTDTCYLCGGPEDIPCAAGQFCNLIRGTCYEQAYGACWPIPTACQSYYLPVCGCDAETHPNDCAARTDAVSIAHSGSCESSCAIGEPDACPPFAFCQSPDGCGSTSGACQPRPALCDDTFEPVCGCDGRTYRNRCLADQASVSIDHQGECSDNCLTDPDKTEPGVCGCGVPDDDIDGDGTPDCIDVCADDPASQVAGVLSPEYKVNQTFPCVPRVPDVSVHTDGRAVIVWMHGDGVSGRMFDADGTPSSHEIRITDDGERPRIAVDPDGGFVVVWQYDHGEFDEEIVGRAYDPTGIPRGPAFPINQTQRSTQDQPQIAMDALGNYVVVWRSTDPDAGVDHLVLRRFAASGAPPSDEIVLASVVPRLAYPVVEMGPAGNMAVAWYAIVDSFNDRGVDLQTYDTSGASWGDPVRALSNPRATVPALAMDGLGNVMLAAQTRDGSQENIMARRFDFSGTPYGPEFRVNTREGYQIRPDLAADSSGNVVVLWAGSEPDYGGNASIYGQRYASDGAPVGGEFRVNTFDSGDQTAPEISANAQGQLVATWVSFWPFDDRWGVFGTRGRVSDDDSDGVWECHGPCEMPPPGFCCSPADGSLSAIDDGNACTADSCAPDGTVIHDSLGPQHVIAGLRLDRSESQAELTWSAPPEPLVANVYRGTIEPGASWAYNEVCFADEVIAPTTTDSETPPPGGLFTYVVSVTDGTCDGPVGFDLNEAPRFAVSSCADSD